MEKNFFAENLRYLRQLKGITLVELGEEFELGKSQISLYENAKSYPPIPVARKICKYFNQSLDDMFETDLRPQSPTPPKNGRPTEGSSELKAVKTEKVAVTEMNAVGASKASESPPQKGEKEEIQEMRKQMLEMMMKLEEMTQ